jgi:ADP-ribose pyrophosphatase YjhB (NUDIX family)
VTRKDVPFSNTDPFRFCPADGTPLRDPRPSGGVTCSAPAVGVAIVRDGKALVTVRAGEPEKGRVDVPGGFVEVGEHPVRGIEREVREELGVEVEVEENPVLLATHTYGPDGIWVLAISFLARLVDGEPSPADDVAGIRWVSAEDIGDIDFAWEHDRNLVRVALEDGD